MEVQEHMVAQFFNSVAKKMKTSAVARHGGPIDLNPHLFITYDDGCSYAGVPIVEAMGPEFSLPESLLCDIVHEWARHGGTITRAVVMLDCYVEAIEPSDLSSRQRGELAKDFKSNPASNVREAMMALFMWRDGERIMTRSCRENYAVTDGGQLAWANYSPDKETIELVDEIEASQYGGVMQNLYVALANCQEGER